MGRGNGLRQSRRTTTPRNMSWTWRCHQSRQGFHHLFLHLAFAASRFCFMTSQQGSRTDCGNRAGRLRSGVVKSLLGHLWPRAGTAAPSVPAVSAFMKMIIMPHLIKTKFLSMSERRGRWEDGKGFKEIGLWNGLRQVCRNRDDRTIERIATTGQRVLLIAWQSQAKHSLDQPLLSHIAAPHGRWRS